MWLGKPSGTSSAAKKRPLERLRNPNCVPAGVPAKPKRNSGKACENNIVNNPYNASRKTRSGD
jgi:hypothetical protein